jgi:hypothetical protein
VNVLVLASEPITGSQLRDALGDDIAPAQTEVMVVAPALTESPIKFWFSDADEAIARAEQVKQRSLEKLGEEGLAATADTGESDPIQAIEDALSTFGADRIVLFTRADEAQRYREDVDLEEIEERFGLPVTRVAAAG